MVQIKKLTISAQYVSLLSLNDSILLGFSSPLLLWVYLSSIMILLHEAYLKFKENTIQGRYVTNVQIINYLESISSQVHIETVGHSVQERPIQSITIGQGEHKLLLWSQMHGNESTTTKAVLDLLNFLISDSIHAHKILKNCTLKIIPILNPDGAALYTRVNANQVDLNRDAQDRTQPESIVLRNIYEDFQPDYCFNLHDQRTIFNVGSTSKPATVSFLAPAHDKERNISKTRGSSMRLIVAMNQMLQKLIPGQVGRYDDGFNSNCVGDTFQMLATPTVLFEAGHYKQDYDREKTREYIFKALMAALECISENNLNDYLQKDYFSIPENQKLFYDVLIKHANLLSPSYSKDIAILYTEVLSNGKITFEGSIEKNGSLEGFYGHKIYDCSNENDLQDLKKENFWNLLKD